MSAIQLFGFPLSANSHRIALCLSLLGIGLARNDRAFGVPSAGDYAAPRGERALAYFDAHLSARPFLELGRPTLADVSVFPFVAVAPGAGLPILEYEHIQTWLGRLAALPGFIAMPLVSRGR